MQFSEAGDEDVPGRIISYRWFTMFDKSALMALVREKALMFGDFTLASGKKAKYYLDGKQVAIDPFGAKLVLCQVKFDGFVVPPLGGKDRLKPELRTECIHQFTIDKALVAEGILDLMAGEGMPKAVGGMAIGADPITSSVVVMSAVWNLNEMMLDEHRKNF